MAAKELKLMTFAYLGESWAPCGQLAMTEQGPELLASSFAYGLNYLNRADAIAKIAPAFRHLDDISTADTRKLLP